MTVERDVQILCEQDSLEAAYTRQLNTPVHGRSDKSISVFNGKRKAKNGAEGSFKVLRMLEELWGQEIDLHVFNESCARFHRI